MLKSKVIIIIFVSIFFCQPDERIIGGKLQQLALSLNQFLITFLNRVRNICVKRQDHFLAEIKPKVFFLVLILISDLYSQIFHINGNVSADSAPVRYASIIFIDEDNSLNTFTALTDTAGNYQFDITTGINVEPIIARTFELAQNYPNPFASETQISYKLENNSEVCIKIYNILGEEIRVFNIGSKASGVHGVRWDGKNSIGNNVASGIYLYQLKADNETQVKKMVHAGGGTIPLTPFLSVNLFKTKRIEKTETIANTKVYTCRIENNNDTNPKILTKEIEGIKIDRDSTIDFIVAKESDAYFPIHIGNEWIFQLESDTTLSYAFNIIKTKKVNEKTYYGFNRGMPFFPDGLSIESFDSVFVRQNEKGDIMLLVDSIEYPYVVFSNPFKEGQSNLVRSKIKDVDYYYTIESMNDSINTPIGQFNHCVVFVNYFPQVMDSDCRIWFAPGFGPVKISVPEGCPLFLVKYSIKNN